MKNTRGARVNEDNAHLPLKGKWGEISLHSVKFHMRSVKSFARWARGEISRQSRSVEEVRHAVRFLKSFSVTSVRNFIPCDFMLDTIELRI